MELPEDWCEWFFFFFSLSLFFFSFSPLFIILTLIFRIQRTSGRISLVKMNTYQISFLSLFFWTSSHFHLIIPPCVLLVFLQFSLTFSSNSANALESLSVFQLFFHFFPCRGRSIQIILDRWPWSLDWTPLSGHCYWVCIAPTVPGWVQSDAKGGQARGAAKAGPHRSLGWLPISLWQRILWSLGVNNRIIWFRVVRKEFSQYI